jgi:hypothetical protein
MKSSHLLFVSAFCASVLAPLPAVAETPPELLAAYEAEAGVPASAVRGEVFFKTVTSSDWSCATCHTKDPAATGKHAVTHKAIKPLAPAANPARFTKLDKVEKWFKRNCKDVLDRVCTAGEKADLIAWLIPLTQPTQPTQTAQTK